MPKVSKAREAKITIRLSKATLEAIRERAEDAKLPPVDWCRSVLNRALEFDSDLYILLREVVATRLDTRALVREQLQFGKLTAERFAALMRESNDSKESVAQKVLAEGRKAANLLPSGDGEK
jgi:hypothetical protein